MNIGFIGLGTMGAPMAANVLRRGFKIDLAHKDIGLALNWANRARLSVPMAALTRERYSQARAQGWGGEDCTAIVNLVKDLGRLA